MLTQNQEKAFGGRAASPGRRGRVVLAFAAFILCFAILLSVLLSGDKGKLKLPGGPGIPVVTLGDTHAVVLAMDGSLWSWGGEDRGWPVLGQGTRDFTANLLRIGSETNWVGVSAGSDHNLALKSDGTVWAWGANYRGQLGDGTFRAKSGSGKVTMKNRPGKTLDGNDWVQVKAGFSTSFALRRDGTLWGWGLNNFGQLGDGSWTDAGKPVQIGTATNWSKIRTGGVSAGAIRSDGSLWIWGGSPKLGNTTPQSPQNLLVPTRLTGDTNWVDLSVAFNIWLGIKSDGTLWAWGRNADLFTGAYADACETPTRIGSESNWISVWSSGGGVYHVLKKRDGSFWSMESADKKGKLKKLDLPWDIVACGAGGGAAAFITDKGELWTCGTVLGQHSQTDRAMRFLEGLCWRVGIKVRREHQASPIIRERPWQLRTIDEQPGHSVKSPGSESASAR